MRNFQLISRNVDMVPLHHSLIRQPELWNQNKFRTQYKDTPHAQVDDICIRYSSEAKPNADTAPVQNDHGAVWFPAAEKLPEVKALVLDLMRYTSGFQLDRVLISRLRPGSRVLPHADDVGDYVHLDGIARYHLIVQGLPGSQFECAGEKVQMMTGEVWWFDALKMHDIINNSADDRIHLMADIRRWPC